jgi:dihydrofolate reductase
MTMSKVVCDMSASVDGFVAGPNQRADAPFGDGIDDSLHRWMFDEPEENAAEMAAVTAVGANIMGRNMFGPGRGEWDLDWKGWWGPEPPYHGPVFVLTHHEREPLPMDGGTTFTFVTDGVDAALARAQDAAGPGKGILISGGAATIQQSLKAGFVDSFQLHVVPVILGAGTRLLDGLDPGTLTLDRVVDGPGVTHLRYAIA